MTDESNKVSPDTGASDKDKEKYTLDPKELENGPVENRSCTDWLFCLIFVAFLVGMVGVSGYGLTYGEPQLLLTLWDADQNGCGYNTTTKDYPYLYYPTIDFKSAQKADPSVKSASEILKFGVCVKECPSGDEKVAVQCHKPRYMAQQAKSYKDCVFQIGYEIDIQGKTKKTLYVPLRYETTLLGGKVCVPSSAALKNKTVETFYNEVYQPIIGKYQSGVTEFLSDLMATQNVLFISLGTAFLIGFVYLLVLRCFGGPMIWISIVLLILGSAYGGYMLFEIAKGLGEGAQYYDAYHYGSFVIWGFAALVFLCVLCNCKNIRVGIALSKCTAQFIADTPQAFFVPPIAGLVVVTWMLVWMPTALFIASVGQIKPDDDLPFMTTVVWNDKTRYAVLYSLFGYLWMNAFIIGTATFVIAAACAQWYFSSTADSNGKGSLIKGLYWVFRYHLGSIALGAFLIALVQFIRILFEYYKKQIEKANKENPAIKAILCLTSYLLDCLERFIKFITKNAYIQIALTGKNFCASAWNAFVLILKSPLLYTASNAIGLIFNVLGVLFIMAGNALFVYAMLHYVPAFKGLTQNWIPPVAIGAIQGFIIGVMFMSVYSFASDTIIQAYMVDEDMGRGEGQRPATLASFFESQQKD